ncbi:hypothetical protein L1987_46079 [Smallanthus sonchifolius]|uniref:Uncharacterized protein n=1 Tax=Smallanthus sonchifolius TaxID=185202 RepID=A0ACB9FYK9_9ASTR|nr:hypothetical protein L1987_46079 [Smallanthus sonchifolius]
MGLQTFAVREEHEIGPRLFWPSRHVKGLFPKFAIESILGLGRIEILRLRGNISLGYFSIVGETERLSSFCAETVFFFCFVFPVPSLVPFPDMGDANPPARRIVHQRASDGITGARSSITRPTVPNNNNWQIPSHHGLSDWAIVEKFYNGLTFGKQQMFNTAAGGHIMDKKEAAECEEMFESFALAEKQHHLLGLPFLVLGHPPRSLEVFIRGGHDTRDCPISQQEHVDFNQFNGGDAGQSSGSSARDTKIEEMLENQTQMLAELIVREKETQHRFDGHDTLLRNQQSAFLDLQHTVGHIVENLKDKQGSSSSGTNAAVMVVTTSSREGQEREESPVV